MSSQLTTSTRRGTLAAHILPISGTMIGVCATLIGLAKIAQPTRGPSHVDELAAIAAITFLVSALTRICRSASARTRGAVSASNEWPT